MSREANFDGKEIEIKMTVNGITTTNIPGQEQYEFFVRKLGRWEKQYCQYDYRHTNGELFSCIKPSIEACRLACDAWLKSKHISERG